MHHHPDVGSLPPCRHCTGSEWRECDVHHDDHRVIIVFGCSICGSFGLARYPTDNPHVTFTAAFDI